ncbi:MAG TPA: MFS transporter [Caulobacteraceae bacterium]|jgi:PAT family beta-lactamase induction signal transducer AmpG|nr:MFS transporter [Caulobacteraceae bacterium]
MVETTATPDEPAGAHPPARKRRAGDVLRALSRPKVAVMLALGFASGLPFMLIGNTMSAWLAAANVEIKTIGFATWIGLAYLVKFLWGAIVDHLPAPVPGRLGRRRGWMLTTQVIVGLGLVGMAISHPGPGHLSLLLAFGVATAVGAAAQDTVIDAWRIEIASDLDELGLLTSAYSLGFRAALVATEALILLLAANIGWPISYAIYGAMMLVGIAATFAAREPARAEAVMGSKEAVARVHPVKAGLDAIVGPFVAFFRAHGAAMGALMLAMITLYHLCDYLRGPMSLPFYQAANISLPTIAAVRASVGFAGTLAGIALGGLASLRIGAIPTLIVGSIVQPIAIAAFALIAFHGGDFALIDLGGVKLSAFAAIMTGDSLAIGFSGVGLVAYMSSLTSLGYTATQYALLTSAMAWAGKISKGFSGVIVEALKPGHTLLQAYGLFYVAAGLVGAPAVVLTIWLALAERRRLRA